MNGELYSEDELFVLVTSAVMALLFWGSWLWGLRLNPLLADRSHRAPAFLGPSGCALVLFIVLKLLAAEDVRYSALYLIFYVVLGAAWVGAIGIPGLTLLGLRARDDWMERRNKASGVAVLGGLLAVTLCYAGANVGQGPGWWVVVFSAWVATASLLCAWAIVSKWTGLGDTISIDRDVAAGLRAAGFLVAGGIVLGNAAAGNWVSAGAMLSDFACRGWPVLVLAGGALGSERFFRPVTDRDWGSISLSGLMPASGYIGLALLTLAIYPIPTP